MNVIAGKQKSYTTQILQMLVFKCFVFALTVSKTLEATHPLWAIGHKKINHAEEEIIVAFRANTMWVLLQIDTDQKNCQWYTFQHKVSYFSQFR